MSKEYNHLDLPEIKKKFIRKIRPGFGGYTLNDRDHGKFAKEQITILDSISKKFKTEKKTFGNHSQELVLKVKTKHNVHDDTFRKDLKSVECDTLVSEKKSDNEWIISSVDGDLKKLKNKLMNKNKTKPDFIDNIEHFQALTYEDKKGPLLKKNPLGKIEINKIILSLIHKESDIDNKKINSTIDEIASLADKDGFAVHDKLITENVCLVLVECNEVFLKKISSLDLISKIDRPAQFKLEQDLSIDLNAVGDNTPPAPNDHGILVMDSGIKLNPLLADAVKNPGGMIGLPDRNKQDDRAHGTKVAGIALHGNIQDKISTGFRSEVWIYSAKIFYQDGEKTILNDKKTPESIIKENIHEILKKYPKCKIINLSFGNTNHVPNDTSRQFDLASLIDDLSNQYKNNDVIFVISNGNISENYYRENKYPNYLLNSDSEIRLNDPATSAHAISVGALQDFDSQLDQPSTITRIGPGINGMIKPELVESGGGFNGEIMLLNPDFKNRLFTKGMGTSFSAPKIAHYLALLFNKYPHHHRNLIICFLLSSANFPTVMPKDFPRLTSNIKNSDMNKLLNIYGYGKPEITNALHTSDDRVVFKFEGSIELNRIKYFPINIPDKFVNESGKRHLSVTLVYDPPTRKNRAHYLGIHMDFHLFKNISLDTLMKKFNVVELGDDNSDEEIDDLVENLSSYEIKLNPGVAIRKKTPHQHGKKILTTATKLYNTHPLILVVFGQKKWKNLEIDNQNFAVVVTLEHEKKIDLYNQIKIKNNIEVHSQIKV